MSVITIIKKIIPNKFYTYLLNNYIRRRTQKRFCTLKNKIISHYKTTTDIEITAIVNFLKQNEIAVFPYNYVKKYNKESIEVFNDEKNGLKYVFHENKKLYFKRNMTENQIKSLYKGLLIDQDLDSPHLYLTSNFNLTSNDIIADIGSAEGNFSLSNIEKVKKIYLFESNSEWIEALEATFEPWKEKVEIINKFVTNYNSDSTISMDTFFENHDEITFFKVDIEGEEQNFLNACQPVFKNNNNIKIAICTYHKQNDEKDFKLQLNDLGFTVEHSNGYMIFIYDFELKEPYLRRGLLRASK